MSLPRPERAWLLRQVFPVSYAAALLGVSRAHLYRQAAPGGSLRVIRLGRRVVIHRAVLEELLGRPLADDE